MEPYQSPCADASLFMSSEHGDAWLAEHSTAVDVTVQALCTHPTGPPRERGSENDVPQVKPNRPPAVVESLNRSLEKKKSKEASNLPLPPQYPRSKACAIMKVFLCWFLLCYVSETGLLTKTRPHYLGKTDWPASSQALLVSILPTQCWGYRYVWPCLPGFLHE